MEYINYNTRRAHTQYQPHQSSPYHKIGGHRLSDNNNKRVGSTSTSSKGRKSPRLVDTPENSKGDGSLISSETEQDKAKNMTSLGMGMVRKVCQSLLLAKK